MALDSGLTGNATASGLIDQLILPNRTLITNTFDHNGRMTATLLNSGSVTLDSYAWVYNPGNQRTQVTRQSEDYVSFAYDAAGQIVSDQSWDFAGGTTRLNEQLTYGYDKGGNLAYRTNYALVEHFSINSVNELTTEASTGTLTVMGTVSANATSVSVNGTAGSIFADATFAVPGMSLTTPYTATAQDSAGQTATCAVNVSLASSLTFKYDGNGNLTNDGLRSFAYDDENQMTNVWVASQWMSQFQYDGKMRRRVRREYTWQSSAWTLTNTVNYVYDGNQVIQERDQNNNPLVTYTRGKDLSGSFEGAGGIGGLLARTDATSGQPAFYHIDANGNVVMLINPENAVVAKYIYDAFGNVISKFGYLADANLYRFSSKEAHLNSGLVYFLYRFYDPNLQRWPNRDPWDEKGFETIRAHEILPLAFSRAVELSEQANLYLFARNIPTSKIDSLGLCDCDPIDCALASFDLGIALAAEFAACGDPETSLGVCQIAAAAATAALAHDAKACAGCGPTGPNPHHQPPFHGK